MQGIVIVSIIFGSIVLALAVIGGTLIIAIRIIKGGLTREDRQKQANEAKTIQELYQGLARLEERLEALETILFALDSDRKEQNHEKA